MKCSVDRILTTHVGSLPRPPELIEFMRAVGRGEPYDARRRTELVQAAVNDVVARQVAAGIDVVNDGEMGKPGFINYANDRLGGFEAAPAHDKSMWSGTRETKAFPEFYASELQTIDKRLRMQCTGKISIGRRS
jgi:5-methyltetrahydropteroyltriglutamate--homocysteine methyltransferase